MSIFCVRLLHCVIEVTFAGPRGLTCVCDLG